MKNSEIFKPVRRKNNFKLSQKHLFCQIGKIKIENALSFAFFNIADLQLSVSRLEFAVIFGNNH